MASGGKRLGAGRKKGSQNKTTKARREAAQRIAQAETTPLDVLNAGMLHHYEQWQGNKADDDLAAAVDYAAKAAPYVHPRLASTDSTVTHDVEDRWAALIVDALGKSGTFDDWRESAGRSEMASEQSVHHNGQDRE